MRREVRHIDAISLLRGFDPDSIDLIVTDPPYGIGYHSNHYKDKNPHAPVANDWNFSIGGFLAECSRVLKPGGAAYLFCRWDVTPLWMPYVNSPLKLKTVIAWVKDNWSAGDLEGSFGNQYEQILFIAKGRHKLRGKRWPNVWNFSRVPAKQLLHPTQKPVALLERAILASSDDGMTVVDPFCGSGSTGEACMNTGRGFVMGDVDPAMVQTASCRVGLPVEFEPLIPVEREPSGYELSIPNMAEYGIHPEDLAYIKAHLDMNVGQHFKQIALFA